MSKSNRTMSRENLRKQKRATHGSDAAEEHWGTSLDGGEKYRLKPAMQGDHSEVKKECGILASQLFLFEGLGLDC